MNICQRIYYSFVHYLFNKCLLQEPVTPGQEWIFYSLVQVFTGCLMPSLEFRDKTLEQDHLGHIPTCIVLSCVILDK